MEVCARAVHSADRQIAGQTRGHTRDGSSFHQLFERKYSSYVCYLSYISNFYEKRRRNIRIVFWVFFCFVVSSEIGLDKKMLVFFPKLFCIQYFILDSKTLRFPCCRSFFLGTKLVEEKPSEVRTVYIIARLSLQELD